MPRCTHWVIKIRLLLSLIINAITTMLTSRIFTFHTDFDLFPNDDQKESNATPAFPLHRYYKQAKPTPVLTSEL
ncbi:hypothetical protein T06_12204 [Trichinella sp. T6]|nr:hypothetical protein T06_12204 [Trichinella sp. T6]